MDDIKKLLETITGSPFDPVSDAKAHLNSAKHKFCVGTGVSETVVNAIGDKFQDLDADTKHLVLVSSCVKAFFPDPMQAAILVSASHKTPLLRTLLRAHIRAARWATDNLQAFLGEIDGAESLESGTGIVDFVDRALDAHLKEHGIEE